MPGATKAQRAATAQRRTQAIALRLAGVDYQSIADQLGYASRGAACTDIQRALEQALVEQARDAEVLRQQELLRLDRIQAGVWKNALAGDPRSAEVALKVVDRRCKLLGLDAPARLELITMGAIEAAIADLERQLGEGAPPVDRGIVELVGGGEAGAVAAPPGASG
jgi:hypothetical protein